MTNSLYIHIPFCHNICGYCDFVRVGYHEKLVDQYLEGLKLDIQKLTGPFQTIYIGGGTPSSLNEKQTKCLLQSVAEVSQSVLEYTIEVNPESLTFQKAQLYKQYGINRVSLGVQSTCNQRLAQIGRKHTFQSVITAIDLLRQVGIDNVSMDLIYGLPQQTLTELSEDIDHLLALQPKHLSLYSLTIEPHSLFGHQHIKPVDNELETEMYLLIQQKLTSAGYLHYEISNYCLAGYQSKHNLSYWHYDDFVGIGVGASSKIGLQRFTNARNINDYILGKRVFDETIVLTKPESLFEMMMMNLRLKDGIDLERIKQIYDVDIVTQFHDVITRFVKQGSLVLTKKRLYATEQGRLMLNDILVEFM